MDESRSTGERLMTGYFDRFSIEHLHRYAIAHELASGRDVLDIACGEGYGSNLLSGSAKSVVGVDIDQEIVRHAISKYRSANLEFRHGSADSIPLPDASVDVVVSFETLEHHDKHDEMYAEIKRVLRKDGVLIISTPDKYFFSDETGHRNEYHVKELYLSEFTELNQRYFKTTRFVSQKFILGSIVCDQTPQNELRFIEGNHQTLSSSSKIVAPIYQICIASDNEVSSIGSSFFEGPGLLSSMELNLEVQFTELDKLRRHVASMSRQIQDMEASISMRLGRALLSPIRLLVRRKK